MPTEDGEGVPLLPAAGRSDRRSGRAARQPRLYHEPSVPSRRAPARRAGVSRLVCAISSGRADFHVFHGTLSSYILCLLDSDEAVRIAALRAGPVPGVTHCVRNANTHITQRAGAARRLARADVRTKTLGVVSPLSCPVGAQLARAGERAQKHTSQRRRTRVSNLVAPSSYR